MLALALALGASANPNPNSTSTRRLLILYCYIRVVYLRARPATFRANGRTQPSQSITLTLPPAWSAAPALYALYAFILI